jgi:hypothetical protein
MYCLNKDTCPGFDSSNMLKIKSLFNNRNKSFERAYDVHKDHAKTPNTVHKKAYHNRLFMEIMVNTSVPYVHVSLSYHHFTFSVTSQRRKDNKILNFFLSKKQLFLRIVLFTPPGVFFSSPLLNS